MSIEPEDSLEQALRSDLPSKNTEDRLRRRLLGAGLAVGNGVAASTAAAAGTSAVASAGGAGLAKVAAVSWGLKVGLAAAVAIPSVGLLWEHASRPPTPTAAAATAGAVRGTSSSSTDASPAASLLQAEPRAAEPRADAPPPARPQRAAAKIEERSSTAPPAPLVDAPSRTEFSPSEATPAVDARRATTLREETQLLDRAFAALAAGNASAAALLVAEHESRYPQGLLVKERQRAKTRLLELSRGE